MKNWNNGQFGNRKWEWNQFFVSFVQAIISRSLTGLLFYYVMWLRWSFDYFISCVFNSSLSSVYQWRGIDQKALELAYPEYLFTNCMYYVYLLRIDYVFLMRCITIQTIWFGLALNTTSLIHFSNVLKFNILFDNWVPKCGSQHFFLILFGRIT